MLSSSTDYRFFLSLMMAAPAVLIALMARPAAPDPTVPHIKETV